jgi:two-component system, OmpR family, osmolarity sensor histidine kinase EnvZ
MKLKLDAAFLWVLILFVSVLSLLFVSLWEIGNQTFSDKLASQRVSDLLGRYLIVRNSIDELEHFDISYEEIISDTPVGDDITESTYNKYIRKIIEENTNNRLYVKFTKVDQVIVWIKDKKNDDTWVGLPAQPLRKVVELFALRYMAIALLLVLLSAWFFSYVLNRYISSLVRGANSLSVGSMPKFDTRLWPRELKILASAFVNSAKALKDRSQAKENLLAGISHDIRTPIFRIKLAAELIKDKELDTVLSIVEDVDEIDELLSQFIIYSRTGKSESKVKININDVVSDIKRKKEFNFEISDCNIEWKFQPVGIKRAIENILENACKHGKQPICMYVFILDEKLVMRVVDHGEGMTFVNSIQEYDDINWMRYVDDRQSHGLGMSIVNDIVAINNGVLYLGKNNQDLFEVKILFSKDSDEY